MGITHKNFERKAGIDIMTPFPLSLHVRQLLVFNSQPTGTVISRQYTYQGSLTLKNKKNLACSKDMIFIVLTKLKWQSIKKKPSHNNMSSVASRFMTNSLIIYCVIFTQCNCDYGCFQKILVINCLAIGLS